jgi:hypothetical protein
MNAGEHPIERKPVQIQRAEPRMEPPVVRNETPRQRPSYDPPTRVEPHEDRQQRSSPPERQPPPRREAPVERKPVERPNVIQRKSEPKDG